MSREAAVHSRDVDTAYRTLLPALETFYGRRFEEVCREYLEGTSSVERIGSWSGKIPVMKYGKIVKDKSGKVMTEDVDIVADCRDGNRAVTVFAECKFTARRCGTDVIEELIRRSHHVSKDKNRRYYVFSRSGFSLRRWRWRNPGLKTSFWWTWRISGDGRRKRCDGKNVCQKASYVFPIMAKTSRSESCELPQYRQRECGTAA